MTLNEAYAQLELTPGSSDEARRSAYETQLQRLEDKVAKAPTQALKAKYREAIRVLNEANTLLEHSHAADNLPQVRPTFQAGPVEVAPPPPPPPAPTPAPVVVAPPPPAPEPVTPPVAPPSGAAVSSETKIPKALIFAGVGVVALLFILVCVFGFMALKKDPPPAPPVAEATPAPTPVEEPPAPAEEATMPVGEAAVEETPVPEEPSGPAPILPRGERYRERLVGSWEYNQRVDGTNVQMVTRFDSDGTWVARITWKSNKRSAFADCSGTWEIDNGFLTTEVTQSTSPEAVPVGSRSVDRIVKLDSTLVYVTDQTADLVVFKKR